ncbi:MAG: glycoside hydrolase family 36 protein [Clostridia bacterium]|jgi:hypothetical protein
MNLASVFDFSGKAGVSGLFNVDCSAGSADGSEKIEVSKTSSGITAVMDLGSFQISCEIDKRHGIYVRKDRFINKSDSTILLYRYYCRFTSLNNDNEVYTQYSCWNNESYGSWKNLDGSVCASNQGIRTTAGGTPFAALWNRNNERGTAFHLLPNSAWKINITKKPFSLLSNAAVVEIGISDDRLRMEVQPGETIEMPVILFYDFDCKTDMGCVKLHYFFNHEYPKRKLPVIFNTWFVAFDEFNYDLISKQALAAADLGMEYFVIDAGWFGEIEPWSSAIGDYREKEKGGFFGKLKDLSDYIRSLGMKFGLWIEAERALSNVPSVLKHPEYFIKEGDSYFLDYANPDANLYITEVVCSLVEKYNIEFIKFDFNADCLYDNRNSAFYRYHTGHRSFISRLREKYPDIYLENCASGGTRMDIGQSVYFDGVWFSDNQNLFNDVRIIRDTLLRMPPSVIERWAVLKNVDGFPTVYSSGKRTDRLLTVKGATWQDAETVRMDYVKTFLSGGPIGLSCDINNLLLDTKQQLRECITDFKKMRSFYECCICLPLVRSENFTILQYSDEDEKTVILQLFEEKSYQKELVVYPKLKKSKRYILDKEIYTSQQLIENGIKMTFNESVRTSSVILNECI